ncbi:MAG: hypothetical protein ACREKN_07145 [Longimicrobiaceae bacterium]
MSRTTTIFLLATLALLGCGDPTTPGPPGPGPGAPENLAARYEWLLQGWLAGEPVGQPSVLLTWSLPDEWQDEPFRVYGRQAGFGGYILIATVTSCQSEGCRYSDLNVTPGRDYEYYVATFDQDRNEETSSENAIRVPVPDATPPPVPADADAVALDNSLYLQWSSGGTAEDFWKYLVFLVEIDDNSDLLYQVGETDGTGFLDERTENGVFYGYTVAAVDTFGHVSDMSDTVRAVPRPDALGAVVYAHGDDPERSGFRFVSTADRDGVRPGDSSEAQWRLEETTGGWVIRPLGQTGVLEFGATTALVCGPASGAECQAAREAPATGYQTDPIAVRAGYSYIFRLQLPAGVHFAQTRVQALDEDSLGRTFAVFDWSYQTVPNEPSLTVVR